MQQPSANSYDALPYESQFNPLSHPDHLAAMAVLYGLPAANVGSCRVLELGCGVGGNAIAVAQSLPGAHVVGVDLSTRQIAEGQALVDRLGLANVTLRAMSLTDVDASFGRFDFIICHGVYSWVDDPVQAKVLEIATRNLAPGGVVFLSYNTYPGWFQRGTVRSAMQYHTRGVLDPLERVRQARWFLDFLMAATTPPNTPYALALKQEADLLKKVSDTYLYHEHLEDENRPVYFHELVARADAAGLAYLGSARFSLLEASAPPEARDTIGRLAGEDRITYEQYLDFMLNRAFRQSLFCHASAALPLQAEPTAAAIPALRFTAMARPESPAPDLTSDAPEPFHTLWDDHVSITRPRLKTTVALLYDRWPRSATFEDLRLASLARLGQPDSDAADPAPDRREFAALVLQGIVSTLIAPHVHEPPIAPEPGPCPRTTPLARYQASAGAKVVNLRNSFAVLRDLDRLVLPLLDGRHDRAAVAAELQTLVARGSLSLRHEGQPLTDPAAIAALLHEQVAASFTRLAGEALFLAE
jgi:cyclopropane fatty-acyl-phospholipid synthase-like methyltransferase